MWAVAHPDAGPSGRRATGLGDSLRALRPFARFATAVSPYSAPAAAAYRLIAPRTASISCGEPLNIWSGKRRYPAMEL